MWVVASCATGLKLFAPPYFAGNAGWYWKTTLICPESHQREFSGCGKRVVASPGPSLSAGCAAAVDGASVCNAAACGAAGCGVEDCAVAATGNDNTRIASKAPTHSARRRFKIAASTSRSTRWGPQRRKPATVDEEKINGGIGQPNGNKLLHHTNMY